MSKRTVANSLIGIVAGVVGFLDATQVLGEPVCKPVLGFRDVRLSAMQPPTLARKWSATVTVDASRCAANAQGHFEIGFSRLKETGPDMDFRERFTWRPPAVNVEVDFWADEAPQQYWFETITPCSCGG